jgi:hypothetical protein
MAPDFGGHGKTIQEVRLWTPYQLIIFTMEPDKINVPMFPGKPIKGSSRTQKMSRAEAADFQQKKQGNKPPPTRRPSTVTQRYQRSQQSRKAH